MFMDSIIRAFSSSALGNFSVLAIAISNFIMVLRRSKGYTVNVENYEVLSITEKYKNLPSHTDLRQFID